MLTAEECKAALARRPSPSSTEESSMPVLHLEKRSLRIAGHRTSVALEPEFWRALEAITKARGVTMPVFMAKLDAGKHEGQSLASAARVAALKASAP
jgi:predicted DNA-binding ribbon-helix-helix protein